ncbi:MAG: hypothetical protein R8P61_10990 [Bacteroidia bacterium]|nr:hypothetical protein [Bacteroidia bacterium]
MKKSLILLMLIPNFVFAQELANLDSLLEAGNYEEALEKAIVKRDDLMGEKRAWIDLIIGTCECVLDGDPGTLDRMMQNYILDETQQGEIQEIRTKCVTGNVGIVQITMMREPSFSSVEPREGGSGKDLEIKQGPEIEKIFLSPQTHRGQLDSGVEKTFLRNPQEKENALKLFSDLYKQKELKYKGDSNSDYFLLFSGNTISGRNLAKFKMLLDVYMEKFSQRFNLKIPDKFISVHIGEDSLTYTSQASMVFGFDISSSHVGYSSIHNFSMIAYMPGNPNEFKGTLVHELMHILLNYNAPHLPPWVAEGLPALFEESRNNGAKPVKGTDNWRSKFFEGSFKLVPKYDLPANLIMMRWDEFNGIIERTEEYLVLKRDQRDLNHATARYFMFYLQEIGKLDIVIKAFIDYQYGHPSFKEFATNEELLENVMAKPYEEVWAEFTDWMSKKFDW